MESRFAHLRQRDTSVSMMRVKMSRRRSQCQKENRDRAVNNRRQLEKLSELECSRLDVPVYANVSTVQEHAPPVNAKEVKKHSAAEERIKMLARYKESKDLQKEKEKREKEKKGVFKVGLYRPQGQTLYPLPQVSTATTKAKVTVAGAQTNTRVTRSMKPNVQKPQTERTGSSAVKVEPGVVRSTRSRAVVKPPPVPATSKPKIPIVVPFTRSANRSQAAVPVAKDKPAADTRAPKTRSRVKQPAAAPVGEVRNTKGKDESNEQAAVQEPSGVMEPVQEAMPACPPPSAEEQMMVEDSAPASSFAPQGFVFQAPEGLSTFKPVPLTPRSADVFLTPSPSFVLPPVPLFPTDLESIAELNPSPPKSLIHSPPRPSPTLAPPAPASPQETQHDVPYFRSVMVSETDRLVELCDQWVPRVEDSSIPEEIRDRMRTAVGQARLLMKERFGQFGGLVDDCDLGRGEKITTCTDLQGFWDMVYFQVEDVHRKFGALKEAESRGWQEEHKPPPRQRKVVKKPPSAVAAKPSSGVDANAAAKSRLAAIKAAVKARKQATKAAQAAGSAVDETTPAPQDPPGAPDTVVFHGGFFQVESPAKLPGSARRSSRAALHQPSPCSVTKFTPAGRTRRSNVAAHASPLPRLTPARVSNATPLRGPHPGPQSQPCTPVPLQNSCGPTGVSLCFTPVKEAQDTQSGDCHSNQSEIVSRQDEVTPYQPECMQEHLVPRDESELVTEPADLPQEQPESCESVHISRSMLTTEEPTHSIPSPQLLQDQAGASEACDTSLPLSPSHGPESSPARSPALSFTLSPCLPHTTPARAGTTEPSLPLLSSPCLMASSPPPPAVHVSSPAGLHCTVVSGTDGVLADADVPMSVTPDTSITEGVPGLDFERYLQPAARCSLSPRATVATEFLSPMATDVEMDSPLAQPGEPTLEEVMTPTAFPSEAPMFTQWTPKPVESEMLLFTPEQNDRIRQSICPSDLMMFTPPSNR